jgi:hypothetical protein
MNFINRPCRRLKPIGKTLENRSMTVIHFDKPDTWVDIVKSALPDEQGYLHRLRAAGIECVYGDCSGLDHVFSNVELENILSRIEVKLFGHAVRLYHGCRLNEGEDPTVLGLHPSCTNGIVASLLDMAGDDPVLCNYVDAIRSKVASQSYQEQARYRTGQIWFCLTEKEMIEEGGVYTAFGSEYRLLILNSIDESLNKRLFFYGIPAVVVVDLPINSHLHYFISNIAKFLFSLWMHHKLGFSDYEAPAGFACYIKNNVPAEYIAEIMRPRKVFDQYNTDSRWYTWDEMYIKP